MQFAGASATGDRRRRRLAVSGDDTGRDGVTPEEKGAEMESELVASAAAAPWVPATELRVWIYAAVMGLLLVALTIAMVSPLFSLPGLNRFTDHLLRGSRPPLLNVVQTLLLALSTQMGLLIGWYRSRCKLDFAGRYRVWPWAIGLFGVATFCSATQLQQTVGEVLGQGPWLNWRGETVAWLLPWCLAGLPISLLLDRDVRNGRSSLIMLRCAGGLWLACALVQLYQIELQSQAWYAAVRQLLPLYASFALFLGLWLHARIVAYVCPDPPKLEQRSAASLALAALFWLVHRVRNGKWTWKTSKEPQSLMDAEEELAAKPKRRRKKVEAEVEEVAAKPKRKPATRRASTPTRTRSRSKPAPVEEDESAESGYEETVDESSSHEVESSYDQSERVNEAVDEASEWENPGESDESRAETEQEEWNEEPVDSPRDSRQTSKSKGNGRTTQIHQAHTPRPAAPHFVAAAAADVEEEEEETSWEAERDAAVAAEYGESARESSSELDEDQQFERDSGMTADEMKGLSKKQRRELKKQHREKERGRDRS